MATAGDALRSGASGTAGAVAATPVGQAVGFNQTAFIFGVVGVAFLIYVTVKGDLPKWLGLLGLAPSGAPATQTTAVPQQSSATPATGAGLPNLLNTGSAPSNVVNFPALPNLGSSSAGSATTINTLGTLY